MGSKGDVKEFFGMGVSEPDQSSVCFLWVPKVACARILRVFGCFGTGPAGVRVFRNRTKALFFMGSKGDAKEFFGMRFAWRVLLVFGCFGTGPIRLFRNRTKALFFIVFYGFQR